jgi:L-ectoine synthase
MIIKSVNQIIGTERDVQGEGWKSRRIILAGDGLKYSVHETILKPNMNLRFNYTRHRETVYCIEGDGSIENLESGEKEDLRPGTIYSAGIGEPHILTSRTEMKLLCIFDPPLHGSEKAE